MLPSIDSLRCFAAAARLLNFRAAAKSVALTPAALGQRIQKLEADVGAALFVRTTRSMSLTVAGLALLPHAEHCLASARDCVRAARGEHGPPPMELTLGTRHELGMSFVVPLLPDLERALPGLGLHLYFGSGPDLIHRVRSFEIDCAITSSRFADAKLAALRVHREEYAFVGATSLLARSPLKTVADARAHTLLDISAELPLFRYFRDAEGASDDLVFGRIVRLGGIEAIRTRVLAGAGVAVLPLYLVRDDLAKKRFRRVFPRVRLVDDWFRLVYRADDARRSVYESLAQHLASARLR